jgi:hypothetical protein
MTVLRGDLHSFTKNIGIFSGNDAYVFLKSMPCFSENISIISENGACQFLGLVKVV